MKTTPWIRHVPTLVQHGTDSRLFCVRCMRDLPLQLAPYPIICTKDDATFLNDLPEAKDCTP